MYSVDMSFVGSAQVDSRNFAFGDSFVVILDSQEFLDRIGQAAKQIGFRTDCHLVEYFNPDIYSGEVGPFRKPNSFEYQREFRVIITPGTVEPVKLKVRSLKDITTPIYSLADINKLVQFNLPKRDLSPSEFGLTVAAKSVSAPARPGRTETRTSTYSKISK
jgi:hypothetical protein